MKTPSGQSESLQQDFVVDKVQGSDPVSTSQGVGVVEGIGSSLSGTLVNVAVLRCQTEPQDSSKWAASKLPFYLIGLLLTATAVAKLWMLLTDPFADVRVGLPREILWFSVAFELWLAFENFRLRDHRVMAFANTVVFASFAIFASVRLAMGYGSCGCSGSLELPAWIFIAIDIGMVAWFSSSSFRRMQIAQGLNQLKQSWSTWTPERRGRLAGLAIVASLILVLQLPIFASLRAMVVGEPPIVAVVRIEGELKLNQESTGKVEIHNRSGQSAKIVGVSRSCPCFVLAQDPISKTVFANEQVVLPLVIKPNKLGPLQQRVVLFIDHPKQFRLNVNVFGSVKGEE